MLSAISITQRNRKQYNQITSNAYKGNDNKARPSLGTNSRQQVPGDRPARVDLPREGQEQRRTMVKTSGFSRSGAARPRRWSEDSPGRC